MGGSGEYVYFGGNNWQMTPFLSFSPLRSFFITLLSFKREAIKSNKMRVKLSWRNGRKELGFAVEC